MNAADQTTLEEIRRLIPILGKHKAARLETAYLLWDEPGRQRIRLMVDAIKASAFSDRELRESVLIEPPPRQIAERGDFQLGTILYGKKALYPLRLSKADLLTHIGIFGSTGSGKTNIVHYLIRELAGQRIPMLIFDFSKRNYRDLLAMAELKGRIWLYTVGRDVSPFRFNPLKPPPGVQISQWAKEFSEVFDHAYWLMGGGRHIVLKALGDLYERFHPGWPKIADLREWVERYAYHTQSARERNWLATAGRPLQSLCFRETGDVFDTEEGILPASFFEPGRITILELDALSADDKTFFIEILLQWVRDWLLVSGVRERLVGVCILEEAHHILNREKSRKLGIETVTDLIFREIRELGMGMIYVDQHPSMISYPALGNTNTHIYMNLGLDTKLSSDIQDAAHMLGLRGESETDYLRRLPVGHAFILVRKSVFPNPFLIRFPLVLPQRGEVGDGAVRQFMQTRLVAEVKAKRVPQAVSECPARLARYAREKPDIERRMRGLGSSEWRIMQVLVNCQATSTSEIYTLLGMSGRVFKRCVQKLIDVGFVGLRRARVYKQRAVYYFLTHQGELAWVLRSGRLPKTKAGADLGEVKDFIIRHLTLDGWSPVKTESRWVTFEKGGQRRLVIIESEARGRAGVYQDIDRHAMAGQLYFVGTTQRVKNLIIQKAAQYSHDHRGVCVLIFVATLAELKAGRQFRRIEFEVDEPR